MSLASVIIRFQGPRDADEGLEVRDHAKGSEEKASFGRMASLCLGCQESGRS